MYCKEMYKYENKFSLAVIFSVFLLHDIRTCSELIKEISSWRKDLFWLTVSVTATLLLAEKTKMQSAYMPTKVIITFLVYILGENLF
jgi:hypothetical protein